MLELLSAAKIKEWGMKILAKIFGFAREYFNRKEAEKLVSKAVQELLKERPDPQVVEDILDLLKTNGASASQVRHVKALNNKVRAFDRQSFAKKAPAKKAPCKKAAPAKPIGKRADSRGATKKGPSKGKSIPQRKGGKTPRPSFPRKSGSSRTTAKKA